MDIRTAGISDARAWNEHVLSSSVGSFFQTWEWGQVQQRFGMKIKRFVAEDQGNICATACIIQRSLPLRRSWWYIPRGIVADERGAAAMRDAMIAAAKKENNVAFIRIDPPLISTGDPGIRCMTALVQQGWHKSEREVQPQHTLVLHLEQAEDQLLAGMHTKTRYNIRLAERKGVTVRYSTEQRDLECFLDLARHVQRRSGFQYHPDEYYDAILSEMQGDAVSAELAIAEHEGDVLAVHVMIRAGDTVTYAHGASSHEKRSLMAPALLYWNTILRAKQQGARRYDFFGVAPKEAAPDHPWTGITRMKEGFGGTREDYIGAYDYILDQPMYLAYTAVRRIKSLM